MGSRKAGVLGRSWFLFPEVLECYPCLFLRNRAPRATLSDQDTLPPSQHSAAFPQDGTSILSPLIQLPPFIPALSPISVFSIFPTYGFISVSVLSILPTYSFIPTLFIPLFVQIISRLADLE